MNEFLENNQFPNKFLNRRKEFITSDAKLDNFIKTTILEWAKDDFPCPYAIQTYIYQTIEPEGMKAMFAQNYRNVHAMKSHIDLVQNVNSHIWAMLACRPAVTFRDVSNIVTILSTGGRSHIGPIQKIPVVKSQLFANVHHRFSPPDLRLSDVICDCAEFLSERISRNKSQANADLLVNNASEVQFMHFMARKHHTNDPNLLGIKITNWRALCNAAHAAKIDSFQTLFAKKSKKLLRPEVTRAMETIRLRLRAASKSLASLAGEKRSWKNISHFANLQFDEAIKRFFLPLVEESHKVSLVHDMDLTYGGDVEMDNKSPVYLARQVLGLLATDNVLGTLFQMAAISGCVYSLSEVHGTSGARGATSRNVIEVTDDEDDIAEMEEDLSGLAMKEWRSRLFLPLLAVTSAFLQLSFSQTSGQDEQYQDECGRLVTHIKKKCTAIVAICRASEQFSVSRPGQEVRQITADKRTHLVNLASCADEILSVTATASPHQIAMKTQARLHLDLLIQAHHLLAAILSPYKLDHTISQSPPKLHKNSTPEDSAKFLLQTKLSDYLRKNQLSFVNDKLAWPVVRRLEDDVLKGLGKESWPLEGSFIGFMASHADLVCAIRQLYYENGGRNVIVGSPYDTPQAQDTPTQPNTSSSTGCSGDAIGHCHCIPLDMAVLQQAIQQVPATADISLDMFLSRLLPVMHGTSSSVPLGDEARRAVEAIWTSEHVRQQHVLADGLPAAMDVRAASILLAASQSVSGPAVISSDEAVILDIAAVPLLDNVEHALKWHQIYGPSWGHDICHFVNEHSHLASRHNTRLLRCQSSVIRVPAALDIATCRQNVADTRLVLASAIGAILTSSGLLLSQIIDLVASHLLASPSSQQAFVDWSVDCLCRLVPPDLVSVLACQLMSPLAKCMSHDAATTTNMLTCLVNGVDDMTRRLLRCQVASDHVLGAVIRLHLGTNHSMVQTSVTSSGQCCHVPAAMEEQQEEQDDLSGTEELVIDIVPTKDTPDGHAEPRAAAAAQEDLTLVIKRCHQVVQDIRINEFGVGLAMQDEATCRVVNNFNNKMARLVEHLSSDLYANASHFVLELIQNADDNRYSRGPTSSVMPHLELVWTETATRGLVLQVHNNEMGFTEQDLRSLCDIGASTKGLDRTCKIGRKGIGFKSVFLVSDRPEVHSNGFHVRFERYRLDQHDNRVSNNALVPHWIGPEHDVDDGTVAMTDTTQTEQSIRHGRHTTIVLPVIPSLASSIRQSVSLQLQPHLLLFLRNIERISVTDTTCPTETAASIEIVKDQCSGTRRTVRSSVTGRTHCWLVTTQQLPVIDAALQRISPHGLSHTDLSVAIPLVSGNGDQDEDVAEDDMPAFAFLPIRSYGLRFIINADFTIPASREDIVHESPWNQWLIGQVPAVLTRHLLDASRRHHNHQQQQQQQQHKDHKHHIDHVITMLHCVPLPGEVPRDTSFHALVPQLRAQLAVLAWLPDRYNALHAPSQLVIESIDDARLTDVLCARLNLTLLHPAIATRTSDRVSRVLAWLGCQPLSLSHLSSLLAALHPSDVADRALIKSILVAIHNNIDKTQSATAVNRVILQLCSLPIWPVALSPTEDLYTSIHDSPLPVFLPPQHWLTSPPTAALLTSYSCLRHVISPSFISLFHCSSQSSAPSDDVTHANVASSLLQRMNVPEMSSTAIISHAIIPYLARSSQCRSWHVTVAQYLLDQCHPSQYRDKVLPHLQFATISFSSNGQFRPAMCSQDQLFRVHLPPAMVHDSSPPGSLSLACLLHGRIEYSLLDDSYMSSSPQLSCRSHSASHWRDFFLTIGGASSSFFQLSVDTDMTDAVTDGDLATNKWHGRYPEISALLALSDKRVNVDLLRYLDINWAGLSSSCPHILADLASSAHCIPVTGSFYDVNSLDDAALDLSLPMARANQTVYLCTSDPHKPIMPASLLAHFPVCPVVFANESLARQLGMLSNVTLDHVRSFTTRVFVERTVTMSGRQSRDFYVWIKQHLSRVALTDLFSGLRSQLGGTLLVAVPPARSSTAATANKVDKNDDRRCELVLEDSCYWTLPVSTSSIQSPHGVYLQDQQVLEDLRLLLRPPQLQDSYRYGTASSSSSSSRPLVSMFDADLQELFVDIMGLKLLPAVRDIWPTLEGLLHLLSPDRLKDINNAEMELVTDVYNIINCLEQHHADKYRLELARLPVLPCLSGKYRAAFVAPGQAVIYGWRSFANVHHFQQLVSHRADLATSIDFLSINCYPHQRRVANNISELYNRWSAPQFILHYFSLPVLEDEMLYRIDNRHSFSTCNDMRTMFAHLEVIVSQWFQRNAPREGVEHCSRLLYSISHFSRSDESVSISVSLRNQPDLTYQYSDNVFIGSVDSTSGTTKFEMLLGGLDPQSDGMLVLDKVMSGLIHWILDGDRHCHLRERFNKFYRSLFDLIESSDRNQVSIFIRSHNLRINPFSIDYIYDKFAVIAQQLEQSVPSAHISACNSPQPPQAPLQLLDVNLDCSATAASSPGQNSTSSSDRPDRPRTPAEPSSLKRKICVSIENVATPNKKLCVDNQEVSSTAEDPEHPASDGEIIDEVGEEEEEDRQMNCKKHNRLSLPLGIDSPSSIKLNEQFRSQKHVRLSTSGACNAENGAKISGRIGEQLAYQKLTTNRRLGEWDVLNVDWLNENSETGLPYDFRISAKRPDSQLIEHIYLEVKATTRTNKRQFELSTQEVSSAWSFCSKYHMLIVFHSGNYPDENTKFVHIPDLLSHLQDSECKLLLDLNTLLSNGNST